MEYRGLGGGGFAYNIPRMEPIRNSHKSDHKPVMGQSLDSEI